MRRFEVPLAVFLAASILLIILTPRVHPAAHWGFQFDRSGAVDRARAFARSMDVSTGNWSTYIGRSTERELEYYQQHHPQDAAARPISPYRVKVVFQSPDRQRSFSVTLYPDGTVAGWERREAAAKAWNMNSMRSSVDVAFHRIAGAEASHYHLVSEGAATRDGLRFTWERTASSGGFMPTVDIIVHDGMVVHAETHLDFSKQFDNEYDARDRATDWLSLVYGVLFFAMVLMALVLYIVGSIRRKVDHRFAILAAAVNCLFVALAFWFSLDPDRLHIAELEGGQLASLGFTGTGLTWLGSFLIGLAVVGGGFFAAGPTRPKWNSLRLIFSWRIWSKPVGFSILAGALFAPLLVLPPLLAAAQFPWAQWSLADVADLFCPSPVMQSLSFPLHPTILGFVGVLFAFVLVRVSSAWLRLAILAPAALVVFVGFDDLIQAPPLAVVLEAALMAAGVFYLFWKVDLLALLVGSTGSLLVAAAGPALLQPAAGLRSIGWHLLELFAVILAAGLVLLWRAPDLAPEEEPAAEPLHMQTEREELKSEFTVAQRAQREMLPEVPPAIPGFTLAASCTPAREVGGDLYDFLAFSGGRLGIAVADVSGKGVPAALYMTLTKGLLAAMAQDDLELPAMLEHINGHLCTVGRRKTFVTMILSVLDPAARTLEYARAGHNPAVWRKRSGATRLLTSRGIGLGITSGKIFGRTLAVEKLDLESGDLLVFYSDGLTEAMNPALEQFGEERLIEAVEKLDGVPAHAARDAILAEVTAFLRGNHPQDDLTLVVLRVD